MLTCLRSYPRVTGHLIVNCQSNCHSLVTGHRTVSYAVDMTTKGQTGRVVRIDDETWADYEKACQEKGVARATDMRMYVVREVAAWRKRQRDAGAARSIAES